MGGEPDEIHEYLVYVHPDEPPFDRQGNPTYAMEDLTEHLDSYRFTLCVIDGVTEAMTTEGLDLLSNADIATWSSPLPAVLPRPVRPWSLSTMPSKTAHSEDVTPSAGSAGQHDEKDLCVPT
jgi:hypothetical protein